jgi:plastocyanin
MTTSQSYRAVAVVGVAWGLLLCHMAPRDAAAAPRPATHTVAIDGTRFQPDTLTVRAGDFVVWINKDPFPHTVTSQAGGFDSHEIAPGQSWKYRPARDGEFAYVCTLHPTMKAMLRVE